MFANTKMMSQPWLPYFLSDFLAIVAAYFFTLFLRFHSGVGQMIYGTLPRLLDEPMGRLGSGFELFYYESAFRIIVILTVVICFLYALRHLYSGRQFLIERPVAWDIIAANATALAIFYGYWYLTRNVYHPRSMFFSVIVLNICLAISFRRFTRMGLKWVRRRFGLDRCRALLIGEGSDANFIKSILDMLEPHGVNCVAQATLPNQSPQDFLESIEALVIANKADTLIVADPRCNLDQLMQVLELCDALGIDAKLLSNDFDVLVKQGRLPCDMIHGMPLVHFGVRKRSSIVTHTRHLMTWGIAFVVSVLAAPIMLLVALAIKLTSPGAAIFIQERIGYHQKPFQMIKFRTMRDKAEEEISEIEAENEAPEVLFKIRKDPRVTSVGRFLRRFSLDELPQLLNVIKGDMVLVGPRPLPRRDFEQYSRPWHYARHQGMPGLSCLWQTSGRSNLSFNDMCILDIYYLHNHTWIMDINIALKTLRVVLFGTGAY